MLQECVCVGECHVLGVEKGGEMRIEEEEEEEEEKEE
jgi:hypothetical protein